MREAERPREASAGTSLATVPGLGPVTCGWLQEVGIETLEQLRSCGSLAAWRRIKFLHSRQVSLNALYALEAALLGVPWNALGPELRQRLRTQAQQDPEKGPEFQERAAQP